MRKYLALIVLFTLGSCSQFPIILEPEFHLVESHGATLMHCYNDIVVTDNRARTMTYGKIFEKEAALEWLKSAIQTVTENNVNFVDAPIDDDTTLEIGLDFAYISHAATNKIGVVAFTARKGDKQAHFRGNSSEANWANTKSELAAALNRAAIKSLRNLASNAEFCDTRPAIWR